MERQIVMQCNEIQNYFADYLAEDLDRSTLAGWVGGACWWLDALHERLCANVFASDHLFADDTPVPVLDPGRGRTKTGRLWVYARDQRPSAFAASISCSPAARIFPAVINRSACSVLFLDHPLFGRRGVNFCNHDSLS